MAIQTPQYGNCRSTSLKASRTGMGNKRFGTKPEKLLIKSLRQLGIRVYYPKRPVQGNPDLIFWKKKVAVFCDGDFWHGRNWRERRERLKVGANAGYWVKKIEYNRVRDRKNNNILKSQGWKVIRFWASAILKNSGRVAQSIMNTLKVQKKVAQKK
jgi:DNA mismatch endonuclease (patch repair protein)